MLNMSKDQINTLVETIAIQNAHIKLLLWRIKKLEKNKKYLKKHV